MTRALAVAFATSLLAASPAGAADIKIGVAEALTGGALENDQGVQIQQPEPNAEAGYLMGVGQQRFVGPASSNLAQKIQVSEVGGQGEVEAVTDGPLVPDEGQSGGGAAEVRPMPPAARRRGGGCFPASANRPHPGPEW